METHVSIEPMDPELAGGTTRPAGFGAEAAVERQRGEWERGVLERFLLAVSVLILLTNLPGMSP